MSIRFWISVHGSPVRLNLTPERDTLNWSHFERCEEGYNSEAESWRLTDNGKGIEREWVNAGSDCDGRLTRYGTDWCPFNLLEGNEYEGIKYPAWIKLDRDQRDEYAEAAGY